MGADIHIWVEARTMASMRDAKISHVTGDAVKEQKPEWECVNPIIANRYYEPSMATMSPDDPDYDRSCATPTIRDRNYVYRSRNYDLFALLANVRNYDELQPLYERKGLPNDICADVQAEVDSWGEDGHSHSWLTISELMQHHETLKDVSPDFVASLGKLVSDLPKHKPDEIRLVFWFDN